MTPSEQTADGEAWNGAVAVYAKLAPSVSGRAAQELVELTASYKPFDENSIVLDLGAGSGVATRNIARLQPDCEILATDISKDMLGQLDAEGLPNVTTQVADASDLRSLGARRFTHIVSTFMIQEITKPVKLLSDIKHCLQPDGVVALGTWGKKIDVFDVWEKACRQIDPSYTIPQHFGDPNAWRTVEELETHLTEAGLTVLASKEVTIPFPFAGPDAFVEYFLRSANPIFVRIVASWDRGDLGQVIEPMRRVVREEYDGGKSICIAAPICVARNV